MTGEVKPEDETSGLVRWSWVRRNKREGDLTRWTLEGEDVTARFLGEHGGLREVAGTVSRDDAGRLVVTGWADGIRTETAVPRDAEVKVTSRGR